MLYISDTDVCFAGKPPTDDVKLGDLQLKPNAKIMMMGTPEEKLVCVLRLIYLTTIIDYMKCIV